MSETTDATVTIRPWIDPVVDDSGFDPRSRYVETFWLGVLGPTATWLVRRLVAGLERSPTGYELDLEATARSMGLGFHPGKNSPFARALDRCVMFGVAHQTDDGFAVRRRMPPVSMRHLRRMPAELSSSHDQWLQRTITLDELTRAHRLACLLHETGDETWVVEHRLVAIGIREVVAAEAADNLSRLTAAD
jgi:hypothetical protein